MCLRPKFEPQFEREGGAESLHLRGLCFDFDLIFTFTILSFSSL